MNYLYTFISIAVTYTSPDKGSCYKKHLYNSSIVAVYSATYVDVKKFYRKLMDDAKLYYNSTKIEQSNKKCMAAWNIIKEITRHL